jgi:NADPH:quinone reductase-like Zn-dependent oxidoreductase
MAPSYAYIGMCQRPSPRRREVDALTQLREADISANDAAISTTSSATQPEADLLGQTVLVIGGSSGIGLETARLARAKGADLILTARDPDRRHRVGLELKASIAAFDATDFDRLGR